MKFKSPVCSVVGRLVHLDVEVRSEELLAPALLCHKEPARALGGISCPTLVLYGIRAPYNRSFLCMEATYPYAIKKQRGASKVSIFLDQWEWTTLVVGLVLCILQSPCYDYLKVHSIERRFMCKNVSRILYICKLSFKIKGGNFFAVQCVCVSIDISARLSGVITECDKYYINILM